MLQKKKKYVELQDEALSGEHTNVTHVYTFVVSGKSIIASWGFLLFPEVKVENCREDAYIHIEYVCTTFVLISSKPVGWYTSITRNRNQMYVWQQGKSTRTLMYGLKFRGSAALFLSKSWQSFLWFFYSLRSAFPDLFFSCHRYRRLTAGVTDAEHISIRLLQISFVSFFDLGDFILPIASCQHLYYPLFLLHAPSASFFYSTSSLWLILSVLSWVMSFNFMPPALAVAPLVSARLAFWYTDSDSLPDTHQTHNSLRVPGPGLHISIHAELIAMKLLAGMHKGTCYQRRLHSCLMSGTDRCWFSLI